jgi:hypothetical protein
VAAQLGIPRVEAEVMPDRKADVVNALRAEGEVVAYAGDGTNDGPALAAADVGLAMSTGTDVAIESAGVTLLHGDLTGIATAGRLSQATMRNIRSNLWPAFGYNTAGIPIAAGVLYPAFGWLLPDARGGRDGAVVGQRHRERAPAADREVVATRSPAALTSGSADATFLADRLTPTRVAEAGPHQSP